MAQPCFKTVESKWLRVGVELVGEEFTPLNELRQVTDSEHADTADKLAVTVSLLTRHLSIEPVYIDRQPWLVTGFAYSTNIYTSSHHMEKTEAGLKGL